VDMLSYSSLSGALAQERERAIRSKARDAWKRRQRGELKLRDATHADAADLLRLARLDCQGRPPAGRIIVAIDRDVLVAAISVDDGTVIADPFRSTAPIVAMLRLHVEQIQREIPRSQRKTLLALRRVRARGAAA
jgi:hypothetical protein